MGPSLVFSTKDGRLETCSRCRRTMDHKPDRSSSKAEENKVKNPASTMEESVETGAGTQGSSAKTFFCPCCNIGYATSEAMINHIKASPIKVKTYSCNVCLLEFFVRGDLMDHQQVDHNMDVCKRYKCDECELDYINLSHLARHKRMHQEISEKLAASGIFLPRPKKTDSVLEPAVEEEQQNSGACNSHSDFPLQKTDSCTDFSPRKGKSSLPKCSDEKEDIDQSMCSDGKDAFTEHEYRKRKHVENNDTKHECQEGSKSGAESKQSCCTPVLETDGGGGDDDDDDDDDDNPNLIDKTSSHTVYHMRTNLREKTCRSSESSTPDKKPKDRLSSGKDSVLRAQRKTKRRRGSRPRMSKKGKKPSSSKTSTDDLDEEVEIPSNLLNEDGSIRCPDCDVMCSSLNGLNRHRKFHFQTMDKLKCVFCDAEFERTAQMGSHMTTAHPLRKCQQAYMLVPMAGDFPCTQPGCTDVFSASVSLTKHKSKVHGIDSSKVNVCQDCGKRFPSRSALIVHRRMHTDERPFKCDLCSKAYRASSSLVLHRKSHGNKKPYVCQHCSLGFTCPNSLHRHVRCRHTGEKPYMCEGCGSTFTDHSQLAHHAVTHGHGKLSTPGQYSCEQCGKTFRTEFGIRSHRERCVHCSPGSGGACKAKPVICEVCGREFPAKLNLRNHMVTHTDERPHKCRFCDATFRHYKSKYSHEKIHKGDRDFCCAVCGKTFYQRINLKTHMTSHNLVKDHACGLCGKKFNSEHNKKRHEKRCRNYLKCPICCAIFRVHQRLVRHLHLSHNGMEVPQNAECSVARPGPPRGERHSLAAGADPSYQPKFVDSQRHNAAGADPSNQPKFVDSQRHNAPPTFVSVDRDIPWDKKQTLVGPKIFVSKGQDAQVVSDNIKQLNSQDSFSHVPGVKQHRCQHSPWYANKYKQSIDKDTLSLSDSVNLCRGTVL